MKIALVQLNPTIGDVAGNAAHIAQAVARARDAGANLAILPEQALIGYPAKDLLFRRPLIDANLEALADLARRAAGLGLIVGYAERNDAPCGRGLFNSAALLAEGRVAATSRKRLLPTYDVFDELRYFEPAISQPVIPFGGRRLGVTICEDMWCAQHGLFARPIYSCDPIADLVAAGADLIVNVSASPYSMDKHPDRLALLAGHARRHGVPVVFVNQVGGNDDVLFDGASCVVDAAGRLVAQARSFDEDLLIVDLEAPGEARREPLPTGAAGVHDALVMGLRDYVRKCGFAHVVLGLSGGVDSAVVAAIAAAALGPTNVHGVAMPGRYNSPASLADARQLAANLGIRFSIIPIEAVHEAAEATLRPLFEGRPADVTEENLQARIRGTLLMALSNKFGSLLLTTGNKSELAVGYCTLYGDMCGGLAVISDVPKTLVYELARHINRRGGRDIIPPRTLSRPPSAELRPDQTDQDTLPPYDLLDAILERYEEQLQSVEEIAAAGLDRATVERVAGMIRACEYKRQQAAPGLRVTSRAFGSGRRMPIAARYA